MAIQTRGGLSEDFDPNKMLPREFGITTDAKEAYICFAAGDTKKMATYEDMVENIEQATDDVIVQTTSAINQAIFDAVTAKNAADTATSEATETTKLAVDAISATNAATSNATEQANLASTAATAANEATESANNTVALIESETLKIYKPYVTTYSDIATTYPNPENGWAVVTADTSIEWRYNGTSWVNIGLSSTIDVATDTVAGLVKGGGNVIISSDGTLNVPEVFQTATGTDVDVVLTNIALTDGAYNTFIASLSNNGAVTTINTLPLYKPGTTTSPTIVAGKAYTVWYSLPGNCFFVKASAEGDATAENVLAGKNFSNDIDIGIPGTMTDNSAVVITPSISNQPISLGFHNGSGYVVGDINLLSENIKADTSIFGISGNSNVVDTSVGTATAEQIETGAIAYVSGSEIIGTAELLIPVNGQTTVSVTCKDEIAKGDLVTTRRYLGFDTLLKVNNPDVLPTGTGRGVAYSSDGTYMAVAHYVSPFVTIYKRDGDTLTKLTNPATLPTNLGYGVAFSSDGTYLAVASYTTPYVLIYKRGGDTFTKLANPATLPTGYGYGVAFSSDGTYLAVVHYASPCVTIYKRDGDTFTKLTNPTTMPTSYGYGVAFSSDGTYLAVASYGTPYVLIYKRDGDTFTKLTNPTTLPTGVGYGVAFSPDGNYLAVAHTTSPFVTIYKRDGDTFTKLTNPTTLPTGIGYGVAFSSDGTYLAVASYATPYVLVYKRDGDTFTKLTNPATLPTGVGYGVSYNPLAEYLAVGHDTSPYVTIYKGDILGDYLHKYTAFSDLYYSNYINFGYAKTDGAIDATIDINTIPIK